MLNVRVWLSPPMIVMPGRVIPNSGSNTRRRPRELSFAMGLREGASCVGRGSTARMAETFAVSAIHVYTVPPTNARIDAQFGLRV